MMAPTIDTRPVAKEAVRRLGSESGAEAGMSPDELLANLTVEEVDATNLLRLTYEGTDPEQAARIPDTLAEVVASEHTVTVSPTATVKSIDPAAFMDQAAIDYVLAVRVLHAGSIIMTHAVEETTSS